MFRKFLLSTVLLASAGSAFAADLPYRRAAPAPYVAAPIFTWTGFYVGLNAGAAFNTNKSATVSTFGLDPVLNPIYRGSDSSGTPFTGGAQVGYNWQFGSFVAGVEADLNYLHRNRGINGAFLAPFDRTPGYDNQADFAVSNSGSSNWFGTARGRLGYAFDRALIYATGGLAFAGRPGYSVTQRESLELGSFALGNGTFVTNPLRQLPSSSNDSRIGWTLGGGMEYALTNSMSLKLEYLHIGMQNTSQTFTTLASAPNVITGTPAGAVMTAGNTITVRSKNNFDIVRAGVNFRF